MILHLARTLTLQAREKTEIASDADTPAVALGEPGGGSLRRKAVIATALVAVLATVAAVIRTRSR